MFFKFLHCCEVIVTMNLNRCNKAYNMDNDIFSFYAPFPSITTFRVSFWLQGS